MNKLLNDANQRIKVLETELTIQADAHDHEIGELNAMVNSLRESLGGSFTHDTKLEFELWVAKNTELLNKTPKHCLASVKADAVDEFFGELINGHGSIVDFHANYVNKLRET